MTPALLPPTSGSSWGLRRLGRRMVGLDLCDSTNLEALRLIEREGDAADGAVIVAEYQTAGRGRLGRSWRMPRGAGVMMSAALVADDAFAAHATLAAAVAACETLRQAGGVDAHIRWPNDILVAERKIAGILVESCAMGGGRRGYAVGIGINCLQENSHFADGLADRATSLAIITEAPVDRAAVLRTLLLCLERRLTEPLEAAAAHWRQLSRDAGRRVRLVATGRPVAGTIIDIDPLGGLLVETDEAGRRHFDALTTTRQD